MGQSITSKTSTSELKFNKRVGHARRDWFVNKLGKFFFPFFAFLCFVLENENLKRAASGLFQAFMVGEERGKSYAGKTRGKTREI